MEPPRIRYARNGAVVTVTFDRPSAHNAMTWQMYEQLAEACARIEREDDLRVAVFRGAGGKSFIAGTDIAQFQAFRSSDDGIAYEAKMEGYLDGIERLPASLAETRPAFILVLYGTNDWNRCQSKSPESCFTVSALRDIIRRACAAGTQAVVGTIIPANPAYTDRMPVERNRWIQLENDLIRSMVQQEGAVLAETWTAFGTDPTLWPPLFFDQLHPVDAGYARIADAFFRAITGSRGAR